ncbi:MAG: hypothetical protein FD167_4690 [bacterium]|nr:MAG: hypothetical protein FD167_4690 [bacterium]
MQKHNIKTQSGFTLLEIVVLLTLGTIILTTTASLYMQILKTNARQQRVNSIERSLLNTQLSLKQSLTTLPGRGLGTFSEGFSTPQLPSVGMLPNDKGQLTPVRLGIVTPFKVNGQDAITVVYADTNFPRLELGGTTGKKGGSEGSAKIILPIKAAQRFIKPPTIGGGTIDPFFTLKEAKGTPSPVPEASPSPTPPIKGGGTIGGNGTPVPPAIPPTQTLSGLPFIVDKSMFNIGDVFLLVGTPVPTGTEYNLKEQFISDSRLVKIIKIAQSPTFVRLGENTTVFLELTYDLCNNGPCGNKFPGLTNVPNAPPSVGAGGLLVPIKIANFYMKNDQFGSRLVRNDGGTIVPDANGNFQIQGGKETILGEADSMTVSYRLKDGLIHQTPNSPLVPWLNDITSVNISLVRGMPAIQGTESLTRKANLSFPIIIRNLE